MVMSGSMPNNENLVTHQGSGQEIIELIELNENHENSEIANQDEGLSPGSKRRKSAVWDEMRKHIDVHGQVLAICTYCENAFNGSSKKGTTHLKNHLERCRRKRKCGEDADKSSTTSDLTSSVVNGKKSVIDLIKNGFNTDGIRTKNWDPLVLNSRKVDILRLYEEEKEKIGTVFSQLPCRFSLRIEWFQGWCLLMVHYIDDSWEPKRKIISFQNAKSDYGNLKAILIESCLDWKIDTNICSVVGYEDNDVNGEICSWFFIQSSLFFRRFLFSIDILFDILVSYYRNMEAPRWNTFNRIRECFDYVSTPSNHCKFQIAVENARSLGKKVTSRQVPSLSLDFENLEIAVGYKEAFCELEKIDPDFKSKSINLTEEQWDEAAVITHFMSESNYTTPNMYFPKFCDLYMKLLQPERSEDHHQGNRTAGIKESFYKYWSNCNLVLAFAVILDPRFKMDIVRLWYNKIYGRNADRYLEKIIDKFASTYNDYVRWRSLTGNATSSASYLDTLGRPCTSSHDVSPKSELDRYLNDPKFPSIENFDILAWWRIYTPIFPTLAQMARDYLAVPISRHRPSHCSSYHQIIPCIIGSEVDVDIKPALVCLTTWLENPEK